MAAEALELIKDHYHLEAQVEAVMVEDKIQKQILLLVQQIQEEAEEQKLVMQIFQVAVQALLFFVWLLLITQEQQVVRLVLAHQVQIQF